MNKETLKRLEKAYNNYCLKEFGTTYDINDLNDDIGILYTTDKEGDEIELIYNLEKNEFSLEINYNYKISIYYDIDAFINWLECGDINSFYEYALELKEA